jgi:hypothetical protein
MPPASLRVEQLYRYPGTVCPALISDMAWRIFGGFVRRRRIPCPLHGIWDDVGRNFLPLPLFGLHATTVEISINPKLLFSRGRTGAKRLLLGFQLLYCFTLAENLDRKSSRGSGRFFRGRGARQNTIAHAYDEEVMKVIEC